METAATVTSQVPAAAKARGGKFLTFLLAKETYGLEILKVQEIIGLLAVTRVPRTPSFVRGVINLRGKVIPVVDLRLKFGLEPAEDTERTCIIVVQLLSAGRPIVMGLIVDEVSEVLDIPSAQVEPTPDMGGPMDSDFILGIGKVAQKVVILLDVDQVLTAQEAEEAAGAAE